MSKHAKYSPSASPTWMNCYGAVRDWQGVESTDSFYSLEGTLFHTMMEKALTEGKSPAQYVGQQLATLDPDSSVPEDKQPLIVTQEMADHGVATMVYIDTRCAQLTDVQLFSEMTLYLPMEDGAGDDLCWGTADVVLVSLPDGVIEVIDFKYGAGVSVGAQGNEQILVYLSAAVLMVLTSIIDTTGKPAAEGAFKELIGTILQPRAFDGDGSPKTATYTYDEVLAFVGRVRQAIKWNEEDGVRIPGEKQCRWCRLKHDCMIAAKQNMGVVGMTFDPVTPETAEPPAASDLTHAQRTEVCKQAGAVRTWLNEIEAYTMEQILHGQEGCGLKVTRKNSNRAYINDPTQGLKKLKVKVADFTEKKPKSVAQMEKWLKANSPEKLEKFSLLWEKPEGGYKLVTEDSPGEPVVIELFEPVIDFLT